MKKLNLNLIIAIFVLFANVEYIFADTTKLSESAGWTKVSDLSSLTLSDYYFAFVDNDQDLMLSFEEGANQTTDPAYKTMVYRTSRDASTNPAMLWTLETDDNYYIIRNAAYQGYFLQTEWNASWYCRTHDNGGGSKSWGHWTIAMANGKYTIQNGTYPDSGYIGPWNNTITNGAEVAANKTGVAIGYFQIYAIRKSEISYPSYLRSSICAEQEYTESTITSVNFSSIIDVDLSGFGKTPKAVSIKSNNGTALSGDCIFDETNKIIKLAANAPATWSKSTLQSDVVRVVNVPGNATVVRAYILPVMLNEGVTITVEDTEGNSYTKTFGDDLGSTADMPFSAVGFLEDKVSAPYDKTISFGAATDATRTNNWMATIPSNVYFSQLSTPGAHDACTKGSSFGSIAECQDVTLQELLDAGVRCFDIRPGYYYTTTITEDNLYIYHGQISTGVLYKDAIAALATFLQNNPTEAITIEMSKENCKPTISLKSWTDRSSEMWTVVEACQSTYASYMKVLDHSYYTLGDFRGKICYINRTGTTVTNTTKITNWPDDGTVTDYSCAIGSVCYANVQDAYNSNGSTKQGYVKTMLGLSSSNTSEKNFHFNFTSSANLPSSYASATNPVIATYLNEGNITGPTGYMMCDYIGNSTNSGDDLRHAIINQNYRYVFSNRSSGSSIYPAYPQSQHQADLNGDNKVTIVDVAELIKAINSSATPTNGIGDMNGNGTFDLEDVDLMIKEILSGK